MTRVSAGNIGFSYFIIFLSICVGGLLLATWEETDAAIHLMAGGLALAGLAGAVNLLFTEWMKVYMSMYFVCICVFFRGFLALYGFWPM